MTLGDAERRDLVAHLAQRFPSWGARAELARIAGLGDAQLTGGAVAAWTSLVTEAEKRQRLPALLAAASRAQPGDPVLAGLLATAEAGRLRVPPADDPGAWLKGALIAGVVVVGIGVLALVGDMTGLSSGSASAGLAAPEAATTLPEPSSTSHTPAGSAEPEIDGEPEPETDGEPEPEPEPEPETDGETEIETEPETDGETEIETDGETEIETEPETDGEPEPASASASSSSPCPGPAGTVIGYAYAGRTSPGALGDTWRVSRGLNVRVDYPRRENNWSSKARVVCVLPPGTRVRLDREPIAVEGGVTWVPVLPDAVTTGSAR